MSNSLFGKLLCEAKFSACHESLLNENAVFAIVEHGTAVDVIARIAGRWVWVEASLPPQCLSGSN